MPPFIKLSKADTDRIVKLYDNGETTENIRKLFHLSAPKILRVLKAAGVKVRGCGTHVISPKQEREILRLWNNGKITQVALAAKYKCSMEPIKRVLAEADGKGSLEKKRKMGELAREARAQKDIILTLYREGMNMLQVAKHLGINHRYVWEIVTQSGLQRPYRPPSGADHRWFNGGRMINGQGYVSVLLPKDDPFAAMRNNRGRVLEHRLVVARRLGRPLFPYEKIHHKDGNKQNNDDSNLELWEKSHGEGQRAHENHTPHCPTCTCKS